MKTTKEPAITAIDVYLRECKLNGCEWVDHDLLSSGFDNLTIFDAMLRGKIFLAPEHMTLQGSECYGQPEITVQAGDRIYVIN